MCTLLSLPLVAWDSGWALCSALPLTSCCCCCVFYLTGALLAVEGALHVDALRRVWLRLPLHALAVWCGYPILGLLGRVALHCGFWETRRSCQYSRVVLYLRLSHVWRLCSVSLLGVCVVWCGLCV